MIFAFRVLQNGLLELPGIASQTAAETDAGEAHLSSFWASFLPDLDQPTLGIPDGYPNLAREAHLNSFCASFLPDLDHVTWDIPDNCPNTRKRNSSEVILGIFSKLNAFGSTGVEREHL